ncbi:head-tail connector protein [Ancylobacter sp. WKF20]|uniref:head-tail connector protein n=1 Tax=Ancylobacter sp. WKF20 TaxID=3039801 RepID=UPI0024342238|nr:head-tail connector protein [Ancylobacter sp. WKF20]WGD32016.1 head-tail connector protein [Ancylobacter sp. WKF20]
MADIDIIPLADLKAHLNITGGDDDALLTGMLSAACRHVEKWIGPLEDFDEVPADVVAAIKLLVGHLYEAREASFIGQGAVTEVPFGFHDLIEPYRAWVF